MGRTNGSQELEKPLFRRRLSRARFLRLIGAGLPLIAASRGRASSAQTTGILTSGEYPIGLWWPPPPEETTVERYRQIAAAGFNFVIGGNGVTNDASIPDALDAAAANDLRFLLTDDPGRVEGLQDLIRGGTARTSAQTEGAEETPSIMQHLLEEDDPRESPRAASSSVAASSLEEEIKLRVQYLHDRYANYPALAGLNLFDEPHRSYFGRLRLAKDEVEQQFAGAELPYVNIWPSYASPNALGTKTYQRYLELYFSEVSPSVLSFDHYPLLSRNRITSDYFYNWAVIRRFSLKFDVPSWVFIQSMGFDGSGLGLAKRRTPDENEIFWQINVSLAYGAKGIQYFTYWTPDNSPQIKFGDALVARDGTSTPRYGYATNANDYLRVVGKVLLPLTPQSDVVHARVRRLPRGAKKFKADGYVRAVSGSPIILSRFKDPNGGTERYLFVANRSFLKAAETRLTLSGLVSGVSEVNSETGQPGPVTLTGDPPRNLSLRIGPGRARLYRLETT